MLYGYNTYLDMALKLKIQNKLSIGHLSKPGRYLYTSTELKKCLYIPENYVWSKWKTKLFVVCFVFHRLAETKPKGKTVRG